MKKIFQYTLFIVFVNSFSPDVMLAQNSPCTILWYPPVQVTDSLYTALNPDIGLTGDDTVHISWRETSGGIHKIPYRRSTDGGRTWSGIQELATDTLQFPKPMGCEKFATEGLNVYLFSGCESVPSGKLTLSKSTDAGTTWATSRVGFDSISTLKSAAASNGTFAAVYSPWINGFVHEPRLVYSTNDGATWTVHPDSFNYYVSVALTPGTFHVFTLNFTSGALELYYLRSADPTQPFEPPILLSDIDGFDAVEQDAVGKVTKKGDQLVVAWRDGRECLGFIGCTILARESTDNGLTWSVTQTITEQPEGYDPSIGLNTEGKYGVAWTDETEFNGTLHIASRSQSQTDTNFFPTVENTPIALATEHPTMARSSKAVHVAWTQYVGFPNRWVIFYQRGEFISPTANTVDYTEGWNLTSLPYTKDTTYSNFQSIYAYDNGYTRVDTMSLGMGYWGKTNATTISYTGVPTEIETVSVKKGWNIIGSICCPIHVSTITSIPSGILLPQVYGFKNNQYFQAEVIEPGRAYWVKVNQDGLLILKTH